MRHKKKILKSAAGPAGPYELGRTLPNYSYMPASGAVTAGVPAQEVPPAKPRWKKIVKRALIVLLVLLLVMSGWVGWKFLRNELKLFGWKGLTSLFTTTKLKGEDSGHVNILLAGNSADDPGHGGANLTDSIMVVSIDTKNHTAFMLSVPRDLYVNIPGFGYAKINEAYPDGESEHFSESGYASGGMGLLEKVVSNKFDMQLNYYALVDYSALRDGVNAVGGVTINVQSSDPRGLYDPSRDLATGQPLVKLTNGPHTLNGQQALNLARARGDSYYSYGFPRSDFNRTQNQRQLLLALKDKATSLGTLSNPIKVGELFDSLGNNVKTDMQLGEVRRAATILKDVNSSNIKSYGLDSANGKDLLTNYTTRLGQSALVPRAGIDDYSEIQAFVASLLAPPANSTGNNTSSSSQ